MEAQIYIQEFFRWFWLNAKILIGAFIVIWCISYPVRKMIYGDKSFTDHK